MRVIRRSTPSLKEVQNGYDRIACQIGMTADFYATLLKLIIPSFRRVKPYDFVIDVGAGRGLLIKNLMENLDMESRVVLLDISQSCLTIAKENLKISKKTVDFIHGDACHLPFKDDGAKMILATELIEHLTNPFLFAKEIDRVLCHDGITVVSLPNALSFYPFYLLMKWLPKRIKRTFRSFGRMFESIVPHEDSSRTKQPIDNAYTIRDFFRFFGTFRLVREDAESNTGFLGKIFRKTPKLNYRYMACFVKKGNNLHT